MDLADRMSLDESFMKNVDWRPFASSESLTRSLRRDLTESHVSLRRSLMYQSPSSA
jgi:hypothetical protein